MFSLGTLRQPIIGQFMESLHPSMEAYKRCKLFSRQVGEVKLIVSSSRPAWAKPLATVSYVRPLSALGAGC